VRELAFKNLKLGNRRALLTPKSESPFAICSVFGDLNFRFPLTRGTRLVNPIPLLRHSHLTIQINYAPIKNKKLAKLRKAVAEEATALMMARINCGKAT
jgi:hypothetical protein